MKLQKFHVVSVSLGDFMKSLNFLGISRNNLIYAPVISGNYWRRQWQWRWAFPLDIRSLMQL